MNFYFGYIENAGWGFLEEDDIRVNPQTMVELTEEEHEQLLDGQDNGLEIVYYDGEVFNAEPRHYYVDENNKWQKRTDEEIQQIEKQERQEEFESKFIQTSWGWYRKHPQGYANAPQSVDILYNMVKELDGFTEQIADQMIFYKQPDFKKPEQCAEEWLVAHQYKHQPCSTQEFMQFYIAFQTTWAKDQYKGETT